VKWYCGGDHAGLALRKQLVAALRELGDDVTDVGTDSSESVDYPAYAERVARAVAGEPGSRGMLVCGTGNGVAIAANKIPGIRCAVVTDEFTARMARAHNDANALALGERVVGPGVAEQALRVFRDTAFEGGRHARRVDQVAALERS